MGHQMSSELPGPVPNLGEDSGIQKQQNPRVPKAISAIIKYHSLENQLMCVSCTLIYSSQYLRTVLYYYGARRV